VLRIFWATYPTRNLKKQAPYPFTLKNGADIRQAEETRRTLHLHAVSGSSRRKSNPISSRKKHSAFGQQKPSYPQRCLKMGLNRKWRKRLWESQDKIEQYKLTIHIILPSVFLIATPCWQFFEKKTSFLPKYT
jgi:hypothetical protein